MKHRFDVKQIFELDENNELHLLSTDIISLDQPNLFQESVDFIEQNQEFNRLFVAHSTTRYIGYKLRKPSVKNKGYKLILDRKNDGIYVSIPNEHISHFPELDFVANSATRGSLSKAFIAKDHLLYLEKIIQLLCQQPT